MSDIEVNGRSNTNGRLEDHEEKCVSCYFYKASHAMSHGYCRRFPPVFTHMDDGRAKFFNAVVSPHSFCGEWEGVY